MKHLIKKLLREGLLNESNRHGQGDPHEMADMLKLLPTDETAKQLTKEIVEEIRTNGFKNFNKENNYTQEFTYTPEDKCLKPYSVAINVLGRSNPRINDARQHYIEVWITHDAKIPTALIENVYEIIKHECGHYYMELKGATTCLYQTHKDGIKKYYVDNQELNLHGREIFERFTRRYKSWQSSDLDTIKKQLKSEIKGLKDDKGIPGIFNGGVQLKYLLFIIKNYVEPNMNSLAHNSRLKNLLVKIFDEYEGYHDVKFKDTEEGRLGKIFSHEGYSTLMGKDMGIAITQKIGEDGENNEYSIMVDGAIHDEDNYKIIRGTSMGEVIKELTNYLNESEEKKSKRKKEAKILTTMFGDDYGKTLTILNSLGEAIVSDNPFIEKEVTTFRESILNNLDIHPKSKYYISEFYFNNKEVGKIYITLQSRPESSDNPEESIGRTYHLKVGKGNNGKNFQFGSTEELNVGLSTLINTIKNDGYLMGTIDYKGDKI